MVMRLCGRRKQQPLLRSLALQQPPALQNLVRQNLVLRGHRQLRSMSGRQRRRNPHQRLLATALMAVRAPAGSPTSGGQWLGQSLGGAATGAAVVADPFGLLHMHFTNTALRQAYCSCHTDIPAAVPQAAAALAGLHMSNKASGHQWGPALQAVAVCSGGLLWSFGTLQWLAGGHGQLYRHSSLMMQAPSQQAQDHPRSRR